VPDQIVIALGALVISGLSYFAGVYRTRKNLDRTEREARIGRVVAAYLSLVQNARTGQHDGLMKAGVATLHNDAEIRSALEKIGKHGLKSPIASEATKLEDVDLHTFYTLAAERRHNVYRNDFDELVAAAKEKPGAV
jgi:hypothetical protein